MLTGNQGETAARCLSEPARTGASKRGRRIANLIANPPLV
jgi:hypothetical protein